MAYTERPAQHPPQVVHGGSETDGNAWLRVGALQRDTSKLRCRRAASCWRLSQTGLMALSSIHTTGVRICITSRLPDQAISFCPSARSSLSPTVREGFPLRRRDRQLTRLAVDCPSIHANDHLNPPRSRSFTSRRPSPRHETPSGRTSSCSIPTPTNQPRHPPAIRGPLALAFPRRMP